MVVGSDKLFRGRTIFAHGFRVGSTQKSMAIPVYPNNLPYITTEQMIEVDRAMMQDYRIELIQMMATRKVKMWSFWQELVEMEVERSCAHADCTTGALRCRFL
jgi:hypothetical protein